MSTDFLYDVFISYSSADKAWVRGELLPALEKAGLTVCIDYRDFRPGAPSVTEMERALQESRKTLLVLTPAYLASAWTEFEALMLQTLDPANRQRRLIPLLKERCELPPRIRYLTYVNFVDPEGWDIAWRQLLVSLGAPPAPQPDSQSGDFPYDVFISYSSADKTWVRGELLPALEKAGLTVCIDYRDFRPGAPSVIEMELRGSVPSRKAWE